MFETSKVSNEML